MQSRSSSYHLEEWMLHVNDKNTGMILPHIYPALLLDTKLYIFALFAHLILTIPYGVGTFIL